MEDIANDNVLDFTKSKNRSLDFEGYNIPSHTQEALNNYVLNKYQPSSFLTAVLANDLMGAIGRADHWNQQYLKDICNFVYNRVPTNAWGSYYHVQKYLESTET